MAEARKAKAGRKRAPHVAALMDQVEAVLKAAGRPMATREVGAAFPRQTSTANTCGHPECTRPEHQRSWLRPYVGLCVSEVRRPLDALAGEGRILKIHQGNARTNLWVYFNPDEWLDALTNPAAE